MPKLWRTIKKPLPRAFLRGVFLCIIAVGIFSPIIYSQTNSPHFEYTLAEADNHITSANDAYTQTQAELANEKFRNCSAGEFFSTGENCVAKFIIVALQIPTSAILRLVASFTDVLLLFSISSATYADNGFILKGWEIVRDLTNILFIFMLLWIAIQTVLSIEKNSYKKAIPALLIAALIVNFSLFATRVIIDIGNISSRVLYNSIDAKPLPNDPNPNGRSITAALVGVVSPQKLLSPVIAKSTFTDQGKASQNLLIVIAGLAAIFVNIVLIGVLLSVGMLFVGRVAGLWMVMILSPLAFAGIGVPWLASTEFNPSKWFQKVFKLSILPTIFLFFVYIIIRFLNSGIMGGATSADFYILMVQVLMPLAILVVLMKLSRKYSEQMADEVTKQISTGAAKIASVAGSVVGGIALGGTALIGRQMLGRAGSMLAKHGDGAASRSTHAFGKLYGRGLEKLGKKAASSNYDVRSTGFYRSAMDGSSVTLGEADLAGFTERSDKFKQSFKDERKRSADYHAAQATKQFDNKIVEEEAKLARLKAEHTPAIEELKSREEKLKKEKEKLQDLVSTGFDKESKEYRDQQVEVSKVNGEIKAYRSATALADAAASQARAVAFMTTAERNLLAAQARVGTTTAVSAAELRKLQDKFDTTTQTLRIRNAEHGAVAAIDTSLLVGKHRAYKAGERTHKENIRVEQKNKTIEETKIREEHAVRAEGKTAYGGMNARRVLTDRNTKNETAKEIREGNKNAA
jgi:hypothetical protein